MLLLFFQPRFQVFWVEVHEIATIFPIEFSPQWIGFFLVHWIFSTVCLHPFAATPVNGCFPNEWHSCIVVYQTPLLCARIHLASPMHGADALPSQAAPAPWVAWGGVHQVWAVTLPMAVGHATHPSVVCATPASLAATVKRVCFCLPGFPKLWSRKMCWDDGCWCLTMGWKPPHKSPP